MNLPQNFLDEMKALLGEEYEAFLRSYEEVPKSGLRVNTGKLSPEEAAKRLSWKLTPVPWIRNGFYYEEEESPARHPYYHAGLYYLQEPSAMTPANLLPVEPGMRVLDLCAAPGGKATELGSKLQGKGVLIANDISNSRAKALLKNLELFGIPNICVTSEEPQKLLKVYPEYFDRILIDAPCSGEGMFRRDPKMVKSFLEHGPEYYAKIQKELIVTAAAMLRSGGMLLYSTCTFSPKENEAVIQHLLDTCPDCRVVPVERYEGFACGRPDAVPGGDESLRDCVRIWPHRMHGEGHFAALIQKLPNGEEEAPKKKGRNKTGKLPAEAEAFLKDTNLVLEDYEVLSKEDRIYLLPKGIQAMPGIRYLRTGLFVGEMEKGKYFEPSQALAMVLSKESYASCIDFESSDSRAVKYLKGETLETEDLTPKRPNGWQLVLVDGWPLGWGKLNRGTLKNKYYPGWRWQ